MKYKLSNKGYALIDEEDYELVNGFGKWYLSDTGYAVKKTRINGKNITIRMHRLVNDTPDGMVTDHINGNKLDNRKSNLRTVTQAINSHNKTTYNSANRKYKDLPKGVTFDVSRNQYLATRTLRKRFTTIEKALEFTKGGV